MDSFDLVIMTVGGLLILVGLLLFISGKRESNKNYLEGFGIKVDVSNPSILLIVAGVGLMLVPRLLPANKPVPNQNPAHSQVSTQGPAPVTETDSLQSSGPKVQASNNPTLPDTSAQVAQPQTTNVLPPALYMPQGVWQLSGYQESGVDLTGVQGNINFTPRNQNQSDWQANLTFMDFWGNQNFYQYNGIINHNGSNYFISLLSSNDPNFFPQQNVPLELLNENGGVLHMRYLYQGTEILFHFIQ